MRVLVTGAGGQLGRDLVATCGAAGDDVVGLDHGALDVGDRDAVAAAVHSLGPDVVFHAAAWTAVDACETDPDRAFRANALGARWVADACRRVGAHLVHVSTDYVFAGDKVGPYVEWDEPGPRSVYGRSKLGGEREVAAALPGATIVRTSWVCGSGGGNMVRTVLGLLAADPRRELSFVHDQRGCPTFTAELAPLLRRLAASRIGGLFHATNDGAVSWYELVQAIVVAAGGSAEQVRPIATADLVPPRAAPRPANSVLDNAALRLAGIEPLGHWADPLARLVKELAAP